MICTLFSPSEGKRPGGDEAPLHDGALLFGIAPRAEILTAYNAIANGDNLDAALALFGLKKAYDPYRHDIFKVPTMPAAMRYDGVAYDYLDITTLDKDARAYLDTNLVIFSNLFGPLRGGDLIPNYKVKQGNMIGDIAPDRFYNAAFNTKLDTMLAGCDILDLRAGYYDKFYTPATPVTTMKFIKGGKVVSHWAKAYRGIVLRHLAQHRLESIDALLASDIPGLRCKEILQKRGKHEVICEIVG